MRMPALWIFLLSCGSTQEKIQVDLSRYDASCGIAVTRRGDLLRLEWNGAAQALTLDLGRGRPLWEKIEAGGRTVARGVQPVTTVTVGSRVEKPGERYAFFDKPSRRPTQKHKAELDLKTIRVESAGKRASIFLSRLSAGPFSGELVLRIYDGSPFIHVEAAMSLQEKAVAYIYDAVLEGDFPTAAWEDPAGKFAREAPEGDPKPVAVRGRTILAETEGGSLAVFPPPHAFFFPRDESINYKFAQRGKGVFGLRQDPSGGGTFVPWFDAPAGKTQRMGLFVLPHAGKAEEALERVKRYTRGDVFKPMEGRLTFTSHWHSSLTLGEMEGKPRAPEFVRVMKRMNVNIVHLAEFHTEGNSFDPGPQRLPELKAMFDLCRKYSDKDLLLLPGEEANAHLTGHWLYLFPKPVYLTLVRGEGVPFEEEIAPYGKVYHAGSEKDMVDLLRREKALAWTAHPRIKASFAAPDAYKEKDWYKDDLWLGGAWKAMPGDLSEPRLGVRGLDLLDDMNHWGQKKQVPGEVDVFQIDGTHEIWGHMNINYLRVPRRPTADDWTPVLEALRKGDFFVTTGEVLIHSFDVREGKAIADLEWTFPLAAVELVTSDGRATTRRTLALPATREFGRERFEWPIEGNPVSVRLEAWDVALNGAFTQLLWLR